MFDTYYVKAIRADINNLMADSEIELRKAITYSTDEPNLELFNSYVEKFKTNNQAILTLLEQLKKKNLLD